MSTSIEDRLAAALTGVADQTMSRPDWGRVIEDGAGSPSGAGSGNDLDGRPGPGRLAAVAAVLLLVVGGGWAGARWAQRQARPLGLSVGSDLVLPGEVVVSSDPLVVVAAPGPEPRFDTSDLGTEIAFDPIESLDEQIGESARVTVSGDRIDTIDDLVTSSVGPFDFSVAAGEKPDSVVVKASLVGQVDGVPWVIVVSDHREVDADGEPAEVRRYRFAGSPHGGVIESTVTPTDPSDLIWTPTTYEEEGHPGPAYSVPGTWIEWGPLPGDASVVTLVYGDGSGRDGETGTGDRGRLWMRPRGGMVVFPDESVGGGPFTVEALDADGRVIARHVTNPGRGPDSEAEPDQGGPEIGDRFPTALGTDPAGGPVELDPDGRWTVLVVGASWCPPCEESVGPTIEVLDRLDPAVRVYGVAFQRADEEGWPTDPAWSHGRLLPTVDGPLDDVQAVPTVLILDGANTVIARIDGVGGLEAALTRAGLTVASTAEEATEPSQDPQAARRDGIVPALAELPLLHRVAPIDETETAEGTWVVSRPDADRIDGLVNGCVLGDADGAYGSDFLCVSEYGEILLLDDAGRIERAYPFPSWPPQSLLVTDDAVYCVRQGDGALPDSMLCRVDRQTGEITVRVFPWVSDSSAADLFGPGGEVASTAHWTVGEPTELVLWERLDEVDGTITISGPAGSATVDPVTLALVDVRPPGE